MKKSKARKNALKAEILALINRIENVCAAIRMALK